MDWTDAWNPDALRRSLRKQRDLQNRDPDSAGPMPEPKETVLQLLDRLNGTRDISKYKVVKK